MSNAGQRGGDVATLEEAKRLFQVWRREEWGWLKARVLYIAASQGEYHGDYLEDVDLKERNIIGAVVNSLVKAGMLVSTGEHRAGTSAASHGRRSYVYQLTSYGASVIGAAKSVPRETLPRRPESQPPPPSLFDTTTERVVPQSALNDDVDDEPTMRRKKKEPPEPVPLDNFMAEVRAANAAREAERIRHDADDPERGHKLSWDAE